MVPLALTCMPQQETPKKEAKTMKLKKRWLFAFVILVMCASLVCTVAALAQPTDTEPSAARVISTNSPWETDEEGYAVSTIPDDINYGGRIAKMLVYQDAYLFPEKYVMDAEGDNIKKDIYIRNQEIELDLGIGFDVTTRASHMSSGNDGKDLYNMVLDGEESFDAVCCYSLYPAMMAMEGVLHDINALEYPHTEMPWFPSDIQEWAIYDHLFFVANNSSIRNLTSVWVVYANADLIASKGLEEIEDVVLDGRWTLAKMKEYSRNWKSEAQSSEGSIFGVYVHHRTGADAFYTAAGFHAMTRDSQNLPQYAFMDATNSEVIYNFIDELLVMMNSPECDVGPYSAGNADRFGVTSPTTAYLAGEKAVFYVASMEYYGNLKNDTDCSYCFIPMPKRDEAQEKYLSIRNDAFNMWCIPSSTQDPALGGLVIEAISYSDYRTIAPKFWEEDFIYRYSDSEKGIAIFEIIRDSVKSDFGRVFRSAGVGADEESIGSPYGIIRNCFWQSQSADRADLKNVWAEKIAEKSQAYESRLLELKKAIQVLMSQNQA